MKEKIQEFYDEKYGDYVRMYTSRAGANDVEDLVQEAFYRAMHYADTYKPSLVTLDKWFGGIIENCLKDLYNEKRNGPCMHRKVKEDSIICHMPTDSTDVFKVVEKEIGNMSGKTKDALYFYFMLGYKPSLIDRIVGLRSTRELVNQFKAKLRMYYPEYAEG
jgi:DNA-directed RNA polymerase specialized sigma24 family protein